MDARAINVALREGRPLAEGALRWFAAGLADLSVSDAQAGAFAMAVCLRGLGAEARTDLTLAMRDSGDILKWDLPGPILDKHSTGGVGDCVSLILAPALAACGAYVPMISGRGLGHTGGTLDKMEAIPGVSVMQPEARLREIVGQVGCAIVGASARIAPADKRLYAIRDVTGTVESLDLITASILSKKLAAGLTGLVLDVKCGSGAFMKDVTAARALARSLVDTANAAGCPTTAVLSDMNEPLAPSLGNALEVAEVMRVLCGQASGPLLELSADLGGEVLAKAGLAPDRAKGREMILASVAGGQAAERFGAMVSALGGPRYFIENWSRFLPEAPVIREVLAEKSGVVSAIDGEVLGLAVVELGGGRQVETDVVNPAVGLSDVVRLGERVKAGQPLARVHAARESAADEAVVRVREAVKIGGKAAPGPLIIERVE